METFAVEGGHAGHRNQSLIIYIRYGLRIRFRQSYHPTGVFILSWPCLPLMKQYVR